MSRFDAILFDFDGVLADSEPVHFSCWREVLAQHGIDLTWEIYVDRCVGVADQEMLNFLRTLASPAVALETLWADYPKKKELFSQKVADQSPISEVTSQLIRSLGSFKLAVVSSSGRSEIEPMLPVKMYCVANPITGRAISKAQNCWRALGMRNCEMKAPNPKAST